MVAKKYVGFKSTSNQGIGFEVTSYIGEGWYTVVFENDYTTKARSKEILRGGIKNKLIPSVCGVGFIGEGDFKCKVDGKHTQAYSIWRGMIRRCYTKNHSHCENYINRGVTVCDEWHNFQNFAKWFYSQKFHDKEGWHLDKDLKHYSCKQYNANTCSLVPAQINSLFTGGIKNLTNETPNGKWKARLTKGKEGRVFLGRFNTRDEAIKQFIGSKFSWSKELAEKYKEYIDEQVYGNLTNPDWVKDYILYLLNSNNKGEK